LFLLVIVTFGNAAYILNVANKQVPKEDKTNFLSQKDELNITEYEQVYPARFNVSFIDSVVE
jgi:hypothetical protein